MAVRGFAYQSDWGTNSMHNFNSSLFTMDSLPVLASHLTWERLRLVVQVVCFTVVGCTRLLRLLHNAISIIECVVATRDCAINVALLVVRPRRVRGIVRHGLL